MNPLLLFKNSCLDKQSTCKCFQYIKKYFPRKPIIADINVEKFSNKKNVDIWYGVVDIKKIDKIIPEKSIDFILTDPPYGGLVQYLDLSSVWLSWLSLYDPKYNPKYDDEITINGKKDNSFFERNLSIGLSNLNKVLSDSGKIILTFNNKDLNVWGCFLKSIEEAGFKIEKVIHQPNKRTGESNVSDPYGMSASDFYIRCVKSNNKYLKVCNNDDLEKLLLDKAEEIILERNEPTPYQILFNGLLAKLSTSNVDISTFDVNLKTFFSKHINKNFIIYKDATNTAGNYWWINGKKFDSNSSKTLTSKVKKYIQFLFKNKAQIPENDLLSKIFTEFPNGLTPDIDIIYLLLNQIAYKKNELWIKRCYNEKSK